MCAYRYLPHHRYLCHLQTLPAISLYFPPIAVGANLRYVLAALIDFNESHTSARMQKQHLAVKLETSNDTQALLLPVGYRIQPHLVSAENALTKGTEIGEEYSARSRQRQLEFGDLLNAKCACP